MDVRAKLRSLALLLALLPQLFVLGLGRSLVLCIAPSGHVQVEVSGGSCCAELASPGTIGVETRVLPAEEPDCGPCSDLGIPVDRREARKGDVRGGELSTVATTPPVVAFPFPAEHGARSRPGARGQAPPHLVHLRSVVLRC